MADPIVAANTCDWVREFGREYQIPQQVLQMVVNREIVDFSWKNDVCPRFGQHVTSIGDEVELTIWCEHPDPAKREYPDRPRFALSYAGDESPPGDIATNDNIDYIIFEYRRIRMIDEMRQQILDAIESGQVPKEITRFAQLHNYFDANMLGGAEKLLKLIGLDAEVEVFNSASDAIDRWLFAGRPSTHGSR